MTADLGHRDGVKAIIADVVHDQGTPNGVVAVVTDPAVVWADSPDTGPAWLAADGQEGHDQMVGTHFVV